MPTNMTNVTNTLPTNVTSTVSINSDDKKLRYKMDCYILQVFLSVIILLFIVAIICYHYTKYRSKQKYYRTDNVKTENNELKKVCIKNCMCYYFDDIIKIEDIDIDILLDEKLY